MLKEGAVVHPEEGKVLVRAMATGVLEWYNPDTKTLLGSMPVHSPGSQMMFCTVWDKTEEFVSSAVSSNML